MTNSYPRQPSRKLDEVRILYNVSKVSIWMESEVAFAKIRRGVQERTVRSVFANATRSTPNNDLVLFGVRSIVPHPLKSFSHRKYRPISIILSSLFHNHYKSILWIIIWEISTNPRIDKFFSGTKFGCP